MATYGPQIRFGYKDFIPRFRAEKFNANRWARLFSKAGAKFVVPVAEHHDGFPMYNCTLTDWSAYKMGPRRDIIGATGHGRPPAGDGFRGFLAPRRALVVL